MDVTFVVLSRTEFNFDHVDGDDKNQINYLSKQGKFLFIEMMGKCIFEVGIILRERKVEKET